MQGQKLIRTYLRACLFFKDFLEENAPRQPYFAVCLWHTDRPSASKLPCSHTPPLSQFSRRKPGDYVYVPVQEYIHIRMWTRLKVDKAIYTQFNLDSDIWIKGHV